MPTINVPPDLAGDLSEALRYGADTPAGTAFRALVAAGAAWRPARVHRLLVWAEAHRVFAGYESERYLTVALAGFTGPGWRQRMRAAKAVLRAAAEQVAAGIEAPLMTGEGLWSMDEPGDALAYADRPWSYGYESPPLAATTHYGSPADGMMPPLPPSFGPPPVAPMAPSAVHGSRGRRRCVSSLDV
jgi:hypothetical protein